MTHLLYCSSALLLFLPRIVEQRCTIDRMPLCPRDLFCQYTATSSRRGVVIVVELEFPAVLLAHWPQETKSRTLPNATACRCRSLVGGSSTSFDSKGESCREAVFASPTPALSLQKIASVTAAIRLLVCWSLVAQCSLWQQRSELFATAKLEESGTMAALVLLPLHRLLLLLSELGGCLSSAICCCAFPTCLNEP
ncbi:hypothetical protein IWZ00DRAFT_503544 [Phyllosticta capitalensis]